MRKTISTANVPKEFLSRSDREFLHELVWDWLSEQGHGAEITSVGFRIEVIYESMAEQ